MKTPCVFDVGRLSISRRRRQARNEAKSDQAAIASPINGKSGLQS